MLDRSILVTNYHPTGTAALIRDFLAIGFTVYSPDSDWGRIRYYAPNDELGGNLLSFEDYMRKEPGFVLITCKAQEEDLKAIGRLHGDSFVLNIAQQHHVYEPGLSDVMICPDIVSYETYPGDMRHRMLYFPRPVLGAPEAKDIEACFAEKRTASYINLPHIWSEGFPAFCEFQAKYPGQALLFGHQGPDGMLTHAQCNEWMRSSYFTVHFKEQEAYGLSCVESMMLGTPVVSLKRFMDDKTLGRCFLTPDNSVVTETVDEAIQRLQAMDIETYRAMSQAARARVLDLTSEARTTDRLRRAMDDMLSK